MKFYCSSLHLCICRFLCLYLSLFMPYCVILDCVIYIPQLVNSILYREMVALVWFLFRHCRCSICAQPGTHKLLGNCTVLQKWVVKWYWSSPDGKVYGGPHGAYLGPTGPRWAPCGPREPCYLGLEITLPASQKFWIWKSKMVGYNPF